MISLNRLANIGQTLLIMVASVYPLVYLAIALMRLSYPFELEWMEGSSVLNVQRVLAGQSLYVAPSLDFIPLLYAPLYYYVSALFALVTGNGILPLRLVSLLSSIGCFAFIFMIVCRRTSSLYASFIAACLFAATYRISGAWFDIARIDSLFLFLLLAGLYAFDSPRALTRSLVSPMLFFLSFFTKQTALPIALCLAAAALVTRKRSERFMFLLTFSVLMAGSFVIMNTLTNGWYKFFVFELPGQHEILKTFLVDFWTKDILKQLPVAFCLCMIPFLKFGAGTHSKSGQTIQDIMVLGALFMASYLSRLHRGGWDNVLMPVYAGIAIYFGIGMAQLLKALGGKDNFRIVLIIALALQFMSLFYWPQQQIPSTRDRQQGEKLMQLISSFKGEVYCSDHPWYLLKQNKPAQAQDCTIWDILRATGTEQWQSNLQQQMATAVAERRYEAFIVDNEDFRLRVPDFEMYYKLADSNLSGKVFLPVTGWERKPTCLFIRRTNEATPAQIAKPHR